jgi:hypothetical protein
MSHLLTVAPLAGRVLCHSQPWQPAINNKIDVDMGKVVLLVPCKRDQSENSRSTLYSPST